MARVSQSKLSPEQSFGQFARITIQVQMKKRDMGYRELTERLNQLCGIGENERNIRNKVARGTFSAGFFFMCMIALGVTSLELSTNDLDVNWKKV